VPRGWLSKVAVCLLSYLGLSMFNAASGLVGVGMWVTNNCIIHRLSSDIKVFDAERPTSAAAAEQGSAFGRPTHSELAALPFGLGQATI